MSRAIPSQRAATATTLEQVEEAAYRAGMSLTDWYARTLEDHAAAQHVSPQDLSEEQKALAIFNKLQEQRPAQRPAPRSVEPEPKPVAAPAHRGGPSALDQLLANLADRAGETPKPAATSREDLRAQLRVLTQKVDTRSEPAPIDRHVENALHRVEALRDLQAKTDEIRDLVVTVANRPSSAGKIERHLDSLGARIETLTHSASNAAQVKELAAGLAEIRTLVTRSTNPALFESLERRIEDLATRLSSALARNDSAPRLDDLARRIENVNRKLETTTTALGAVDTSQLERMMQDVIVKLERPGRTEAIAEQIASLEGEVRKLAHRIGESANRPDEVAAMLRRDMANLTIRLEAMSDNTQDTAAIRQLNSRLATLSERLDLVQHSGLSTHGLEEQIAKLAQKMDVIFAQTHDNQMVEELRRQITHLSRRMDANPPENVGPAMEMLEQVQRHLEHLATHATNKKDSERVSGLEQAIGQLYQQIQDLRQSALEGARTMAERIAHEALQRSNSQTVLEDIAVANVTRQLSDLRSQQEVNDRRTAETLVAIQKTMETVVDRLATLESDDAPDERPAPIASSDHRTIVLGPEVARLDITPDDLLTPGSGRPHDMQPAPIVEAPPASVPPQAAAATQASFIAAARRAARSAQEMKETEQGHSTRAARDGAFGKLGKVLSARRRPLLAALAGLVVIMGSLQAIRAVRLGGQADQKIAQATPVATPAPLALSAAVPSVEAKPATPAATAARDTSMLTGQPMSSLADMVNASAVGGAKTTIDTTPAPTRLPAAAPRAKLTEAANAGDAAAQYEMGIRLADGQGTTPDSQAALQWFTKAAQQNLAPATYRAATMYERGLGTQKDLKRARELYLKAANAGHVRSMHNLGVLSAETVDGKPDYAAAASWFRKAAEYNVRDSQFNLAILYARGMGVEQNLAQAWVWFNAAAAQGDADAGRKRDDVASRMTASQIASAKAQADGLKMRTPDVAANDVAVPAGGWDSNGEMAVQGKPAPTSPRAKVSQL